MPALICGTVRQLIIVRDLVRRFEGVAAVERTRDQNLVPIVECTDGVVKVVPDHIEHTIGADERLRKLIFVTVSIGSGNAKSVRAERTVSANEVG